MIAEAFALVAELAESMGVTRINELPGLWSVTIDKRWAVRVNGHAVDIDGIPPFNMAIEYNGFPAGLIHPGGGIIAAGSMANEFTFIAAVRARIAAIKSVQVSGP